MFFSRLLTAGAVCLFSLSVLGPVWGQANGRCEVIPKSLVAMRHCYRPLLVFSPSAADARLAQQGRILDAAADDMMDRFVMLTPILPSTKGYQAPLDTPYVVLGTREMLAIRAQFHIPSNRFEVLLLGEDGEVKMRSRVPVAITPLNRLIDSMPTRKIEMQRKDAY
jgi:hypothetical protein